MSKNKSFKHFLAVFSSILIFVIATGCSQVQTPKTISALSADFFGLGEELARQLVENRRRSFGLEEQLIFMTIADLDDLHRTSKFGRTLSESLATSLFKYGYGITELRKVAGVLVKNKGGELILSRESVRLAKQHKAGAILAGTYSMTPGSVIINIKLLDAASQDVLSVAGMELNRSHTINYLLANKPGMSDSELSGYENF